MGSYKLGFMVFFEIMVATTMQFNDTSTGPTTHVVGESFGWTVPPIGPPFYAFWASSQSFTVGDTLVFNFSGDQDNVAEVSPEAYALCNTTNPIFVNSTGPATVKLTTPGPHFYISTVAPRCQLGQMLAINVVAGVNSTASR